MTNSRDPERAFRLSTRPLIVGGALMGLGRVLGLAGIVVSGTSLAYGLAINSATSGSCAR